MKKLFIFSGITFFLLFTSSYYVLAGTVRLDGKTTLHLRNVRQSKEIEGYYLSVPMDGETEPCSLSVKIRKTHGEYAFTFNISGKIATGKVKLTKSDNPKELGIVFRGIHWAENNGDLSATTKQVKLKLPGGIEGVWSESGIIIQNYGNAMNNYMQIASCGQKFINLVKQ